MPPKETYRTYYENDFWRASYGVFFVNICEKIDRVIMVPHCS